MRIEAYQSIRVENWGNTGPARIAPMPAPANPARQAPVVQTAPAVQLPSLRALALPNVDALEVDVQGFLTITAALLKEMESIQLWQTPPAQAARLDVAV